MNGTFENNNRTNEPFFVYFYSSIRNLRETLFSSRIKCKPPELLSGKYVLVFVAFTNKQI